MLGRDFFGIVEGGVGYHAAGLIAGRVENDGSILIGGAQHTQFLGLGSGDFLLADELSHDSHKLGIGVLHAIIIVVEDGLKQFLVTLGDLAIFLHLLDCVFHPVVEQAQRAAGADGRIAEVVIVK